MGRTNLQEFPRPHIPNPHSFIKESINYKIRLQIEINIEHIISVALQCFDAITYVDVPYAQYFVVRGRENVMGIQRPCHVEDALHVTLELLLHTFVTCRPYSHGFLS